MNAFSKFMLLLHIMCIKFQHQGYEGDYTYFYNCTVRIENRNFSFEQEFDKIRMYSQCSYGGIALMSETYKKFKCRHER